MNSAMQRADDLWDFENRLSQEAAEESGIKAGISKKMGMTASVIFNETISPAAAVAAAGDAIFC